MGKNSKILIKKYITHILDKNIGIPVLSSEIQDLDSDISEFMEKNILKMLNDQGLKNAVFLDNSKIKLLCEKMTIDNFNNFSSITTQIAITLFQIMQQDLKIPSGDFVCCLLLLDDVMNIVFMKLNYKNSYSHFVDKDRIVKVIKNKVTLPSESQRLEEGVIINLNNLNIKLLEKKYTKNEEYAEYFSKNFLQCTPEISDKEKFREFTKINNEFSKKHTNNEVIKDLKIKKMIIESIDSGSSIKIDELAEKVFIENEEVKNAFINEFKEKGIYSTPLIENNEIKKSFKMQKMTTDSGIEIGLPFDVYDDIEKVEFYNNIDGTISIVIKNISKLVSK